MRLARLGILALALAAIVALATGSVGFGASPHRAAKSKARSVAGTVHDHFVSGTAPTEIHAGTFTLHLTSGSGKLAAVLALAARALGLSDVLKGSYVASEQVPANSNDVSGVVLITPKKKSAGTLCVKFSATYDQQSNATGTLEVLGGTGAAAKLHGKGTVTGGAPISAVTGRGTVSLGKARALPASCKALKGKG